MDLVIDNPETKVKCQIFTPDNIVKKMLELAGYSNKLMGKKVLENSCGDGQILSGIIRKYIESAKQEGLSDNIIKQGLETDILAFDIDQELIETCKNKLSNIAGEYGLLEVSWNIKCQDFLQSTCEEKFDFIIGNPPYISYPDLSIPIREYVKTNFHTCKKGKFDYSYAFIEKSYNLLSDDGSLVYIIPSNIFKNVFASELRKLIKNDLELIYDFPNDKVFADALVSPAIIKVCKKKKTASLRYIQHIDGKTITKSIAKDILLDKWCFTDSSRADGQRVGDAFRVSSSIATLLNEAFIVKGCTFDNEYCYIGDKKIEKGILKRAASPKNKKYQKDEYIIFPYYYDDNGTLVRYSESQIQKHFPCAVEYLNGYRKKLNERKADSNAKWYEFGRSQALQNANKEMILISSVISECTKAYLLEAEEIPYSGLYIVPTGNISLNELLVHLNSKSFIDHIFRVGVCVNGKSKRITPKDIENFVY